MIQGNPQKETKRRISKNIIPFFRQDALTDLKEIYEELVQEKGFLRAIVWYVIQLLKFIRGRIINKLYWSISMFSNSLKIVFRNIQRHKGYSFINIAGLALGIACCILLTLFINFELSFDDYHEKADRIYRVVTKGTISGTSFSDAKTPPALVPFFENEFPEVESTVRFANTIFNMFRYNNNKYYEPNFYYTEPSIFDVFSFSMIKGNPQTALASPNSVVLTPGIARKYFGQDDAMGKVIIFNDNIELVVTGIMERPPQNSHLTFDMLLSYATFENHFPYAAQAKTFPSCYTYALIKEGVDPNQFSRKCADFFTRHIGEKINSVNKTMTCHLQALRKIHLHSHLTNDNPGNIRIVYIYLFASIAVFILLIACINYVNLTTSQAVHRIKEVGVRKVVGAGRNQIAGQFIGESFCTTFLAFTLGALLAIAFIPFFNQLVGYHIDTGVIGHPLWFVEMIAILLFVVLFSGGYPAIIFSKYKPVDTVKGMHSGSLKSGGFKNYMVVGQLSVLVILIILTTGIYKQIRYIRQIDLGFEKDQILFVKFHNDHTDDEGRIRWMNALKTELVRLDGVANAALSSHVPGTRYYRGQYHAEGMSDNQSMTMESYQVDADFLGTMGIEIIEGRGFSPKKASDSDDSVVINETAARQLGWDKPLGKRLSRTRRYANNVVVSHYRVIGVIKDFHSRSLHHSIEPQIISHFEGYHTLSVRIKPGDLSGTMTLIQEKWNEFEPHHPFEYMFLDEHLDRLYRAEQRMGKIIRIFTFVAICIGCLGLLGLVSFLTERRTKEIGIRKSVGASTWDIAILLSKGFARWIILANLLAWPTAYLILNRWLENFAYRASIGWQVFILSGALSLAIAAITIGYRIMKASNADPVHSLRYE